ncbi:MAG: hypothetical protein WCW65_00685 [Candidatus Paceibacterota bacterium]
MTEELKQKIKEGLERLPKEAQDVMNTFEWLKIVEEIGKKYLIDESEINILQGEIGFILIETNSPDMLAINIENNIGTSKNEALKITDEVTQKIFKPMIELVHSSAKNKSKAHTPRWEQRIGFILSGGNYSAFLDK